jgi:hypothetical protein
VEGIALFAVAAVLVFVDNPLAAGIFYYGKISLLLLDKSKLPPALA